MANTKSAIKKIRRITKQTSVNKARKSRYKNALKKMNLLIEGKKKSEARKEWKDRNRWRKRAFWLLDETVVYVASETAFK